MTNPANNPWDLGGGGESFPFDHVDDEIEGFVQDMSERQGTDMQTGEPAWWDKEQTRPVMLTIVTLQTNLRERPNDDGLRTVTLSGSKKPESRSRMAAALGAVKAATGGSQMQFNAWFKMKFVAEGPRTKPGFNPPKYYEAWYRPPVMDLENSSQPAAPTSQLPQPAGQTYGSGGGPQWAQGAQQQMMQDRQDAVASEGYGQGGPVPAALQQQQQQPNNLANPITAAQVEGLRAAGVDPALVYGADWANRVIP